MGMDTYQLQNWNKGEFEFFLLVLHLKKKSFSCLHAKSLMDVIHETQFAQPHLAGFMTAFFNDSQNVSHIYTDYLFMFVHMTFSILYICPTAYAPTLDTDPSPFLAFSIC